MANDIKYSKNFTKANLITNKDIRTKVSKLLDKAFDENPVKLNH